MVGFRWTVLLLVLCLVVQSGIRAISFHASFDGFDWLEDFNLDRLGLKFLRWLPILVVKLWAKAAYSVLDILRIHSCGLVIEIGVLEFHAHPQK